jgi:hypothetical protein
MLAGPNQAVSGPNEPPRSVGPGHRGQLRGLYGSDPFSSIWPLAAFRNLRNAHNWLEYINTDGVFPWEDA